MAMQKRFTQEIPKMKHKEPITHHVFVDTESNWSQVDGKTPITRHTLRFGYARYCVWDGHTLMCADEKVFYTADEFWEWLCAKRMDSCCWVWAHNLAFDGTMIQLWERLQRDGCNLQHFTDCNLPSFFQCNIDGQPFQFLDSLNIFRTSLAKLGEEIGMPKMKMPKQRAGLDKWLPYCKNDVVILHKLIEQWIRFVQHHGLGKMCPSLAGQSLTAYRTRFMNHPIQLHCNGAVTRLERGGYFGGITEPKFIGTVKERKIFNYDVNSLYPFIMKQHKMPNAMCGFERWPQKARMQKLMKRYYTIAHVKLKTTNDVFPLRHNGRLLFPTGSYWTVLHKPELERAYKHNAIDTIAFVAWYTEANIFSEYVDYFYAVRQTYSRPEDRAFKYMCKILLNSLYGKFGQKRPQWERYTDTILDDLERKGGLLHGELDIIKEHIECHDTSELRFDHPYNKKPYGCRRLLGAVQVLVGEDESPWSFPAIAGAVTAYAREHVRRIQELVGAGNLYYTDTDSFFVNEKGRDILLGADLVDQSKLGFLKLENELDAMTIHGPKDYINTKEVKRKGIKSKSRDKRKRDFTQDHWPSFKTLRRQGFPQSYDVQKVSKHLKRVLLTQNIGAKGWTYPHCIDLDNYVMY